MTVQSDLPERHGNDHEGPTVAASTSRRTIVKGAAWSMPVIAATVSTPLTAASGYRLQLSFAQPSYVGTACGQITGVQVLATTIADGQPAPDEAITVLLSGGYVFAGGGSSHHEATDANGSLSLPEITVAPAGGNGSFTATAAGAADATAAVSAPIVSGTSGILSTSTQYPESVDETGPVPAGSKPIYGNRFLTPDGRLINGYYGTVLVSGVAETGQAVWNAARTSVSLPFTRSGPTTC